MADGSSQASGGKTLQGGLTKNVKKQPPPPAAEASKLMELFEYLMDCQAKLDDEEKMRCLEDCMTDKSSDRGGLWDRGPDFGRGDMPLAPGAKAQWIRNINPGWGCVATSQRTYKNLQDCLKKCGLSDKYQPVLIQIGNTDASHNVVGLQPLGQDVKPIRIFDGWLSPDAPVFNTDDWMKEFSDTIQHTDPSAINPNPAKEPSRNYFYNSAADRSCNNATPCNDKAWKRLSDCGFLKSRRCWTNGDGACGRQRRLKLWATEAFLWWHESRG